MCHYEVKCIYDTAQANAPPIPLPWNITTVLNEIGDVQTPNSSATGSDVMETTMPAQQDSCEASIKVPICDLGSRTSTECSALTAASDCETRSISDSIPQVESLTQSVIECLDKSSPQTDDKQEEPLLRKSTRLKQLPGRKYQDFFMLKEHLTGTETVPLIRDCVQIVTEKSVTNRIFNILHLNSYRGDCCNCNAPLSGHHDG
jgi:hypothetical protein